jgi:hypothetical protein
MKGKIVFMLLAVLFMAGSISLAHAQTVYMYNFIGPNFTSGIGPDFATSFDKMYISITFTTTLSPSDIAGSQLTFLSFSMSDTVHTISLSDPGAALGINTSPGGIGIYSMTGGVPSAWSLGIYEKLPDGNLESMSVYSPNWWMNSVQWGAAWGSDDAQYWGGPGAFGTWTVTTVSPVPVPALSPSTMLLLVAGLAGVVAFRGRVRA